MQALDPAGNYSDAEVIDELVARKGARTMTYRYDRLSAEGDYLGPLDNVLGGKVTNNALAEIKRTATFTLRETGELNYLRDRVQPFARLAMPPTRVLEPGPQVRRNLSTNPRFVGNSGWTLPGASGTYLGDGVVAISDASSSGLLPYETTSLPLPATVGDVVTVSRLFYVPPTSNAVTLRLALVAYNSAGNSLGPIMYGPTVTINPGESTRLSVTHSTLPANTVSVRSVPYVMAGGSGRVLGMTEALVEHAAEALPYFDGGTTDETVEGGYVYEWTGSANASASVARRLTVALDDGVELRRNRAAYPSGLTNRTVYVSVVDAAVVELAPPKRYVRGVPYDVTRVRETGPNDTSRLGLRIAGLSIAQPSTVSLDVFVPTGSPFNGFAAWIARDDPNNDSAAADFLSSGTVAYTEGQWQRVEVYIAPKAGRTVTSVYFTPGGDPALGSGAYWDSACFMVLDGDQRGAEFFDGRTPGDGTVGGRGYRWAGAVNASESIESEQVAAPDPRPGFVEWPLGVFVLETPKRVLDDVGVVTREVEAYDLAVVLNDEQVSDRYSIAAGTLYTSAVATIAAGAGLDYAITPSTLALPVAAEWPPGTTKLRIVNDLLAAINYESASFDELGRLVARPYQSPADRAVEYTYADGEASVRLGGAEQELDLFGVPNRVTLVKSEADQGAALVATVTNADPLSPTSTVSRGRTISAYYEDDDAPDLATLQAKAARRLFEASQIFEAVSFETAAMPMHGNLDVLALNLPGLAVDARYVEQSWELPLEVGARMKHRARRVVTI